MKILKKIFQTIFRTSVLSLLIASSPFENHADNKVATIASHCIEEGQVVTAATKEETAKKEATKKETVKEEIAKEKVAKKEEKKIKKGQREERKEEKKGKEGKEKEGEESFCPVYVTRTGKCFHKDNSVCVRSSKIKIPLNEAVSNHYRKCSKCFG